MEHSLRCLSRIPCLHTGYDATVRAIPCGCPQFAQKPETTYCFHRDLRVPTRGTPTILNHYGLKVHSG